MITIVDVKIGNVGSVTRALDYLRIPYKVSDQKKDIEHADKIIFPGVGSFSEASNKLSESGLKDAILYQVLEKKVPILGICLGMQLFCNTGYEGGKNPGFGFYNADVTRINDDGNNIRLPHMGWNHLSSYNLTLLKDIPENTCFYFVHSYEVKLQEETAHATTSYGNTITAMIEKDNIFATQFHPEKSQEKGLKILKNFYEV